MPGNRDRERFGLITQFLMSKKVNCVLDRVGGHHLAVIVLRKRSTKVAFEEGGDFEFLRGMDAILLELLEDANLRLSVAMTMKLHSHRYGKAKVRVFKKLQQDGVHTPKELEVTTLLEGDFGASFTKDDNSQVVATDSIKNTVNFLAHQELGNETEPFAIAVTRHFLKKYSHVTSVTVETL